MPRDALRKGRVSLPGHVYHITTCTLNRVPAFRDFLCARLAVAQMRQLHESGEVGSLAWVVMPDHVHWLFQLGHGRGLSEVIKIFKARTTHVLAAHSSAGGSIWQRGFHDHAIRKDEDLRAVARYIVANPLRAGLVSRLADYPHWDANWL
jgi:REP element-mobilizing transposase RayT